VNSDSLASAFFVVVVFFIVASARAMGSRRHFSLKNIASTKNDAIASIEHDSTALASE
jgi:hypothetical protein